MKNRKLTVAENCLKYGVGSYNIDACRIGTSENLNGGTYAKNPTIKKEDAGSFFKAPSNKDYVQPTGRFPASIILSHTADCELLGFEDDKCISAKSTTAFNVSGEKGGGGYIKGAGEWESNIVKTPKWNCSPQCPCKLLDEQAPNTGNGWKRNYDEYNGKILGGNGMFSGGLHQKGNTHCDGLGGASRFFKQIESEDTDILS